VGNFERSGRGVFETGLRVGFLEFLVSFLVSLLESLLESLLWGFIPSFFVGLG